MKTVLISENRRARFEYHLEDGIEAGIMLRGPEVKSLRLGGANIADAYVSVENGELWLINGYIPQHGQTAHWDRSEERRPRKLLASKREISRLWNASRRDGMTIVPMRLEFNPQGKVKLQIALARGKKNNDKRAASAARDWGREQSRILKQQFAA